MENKKIISTLNEHEKRLSTVERRTMQTDTVREISLVDEEFFINGERTVKSVKVFCKKRTGVSLAFLASHPDGEAYEIEIGCGGNVIEKIYEKENEGEIALTLDAGWSDVILIFNDYGYKYSYFTRLEVRLTGIIDDIVLNPQIDAVGDTFFCYVEGDTYKCIDSLDMRTAFAISGNEHIASTYSDYGIVVLRKTCDGDQLLEWYDPKSGEVMEKSEFKEKYTDCCICYDGDSLNVFFIRDNRLFYSWIKDGEIAGVEQLPFRAKKVWYSVGRENQYLYYVDLSDNVNVIVTNRPENVLYGDGYSVGRLDNVRVLENYGNSYFTYRNGVVVYGKGLKDQSSEEIVAIGDEAIMTAEERFIVRKGKEIFKI